MKILVFGAGALGSFVGGMLSRKCHVTLIGRKEHVDAINSKGLIIEGKTNFNAKPQALMKIPDEEFDLVLITVKSYDTSKVVEELSRRLDKDILVLSLQNGLGNAEKISRSFKKVLGGTISHGITFIGPGRIYHAGLGDTRLGDFKGVEEKEVEKICQIFDTSGIDAKRSDNILGEIWAKAIINASINPLTAIARLKNGYLLKIKTLEEIMVSACKEAIGVAVSCGIELPHYDIIEKTKSVVRLTAENKSSMLQDIENGKRTEIDSITGVFVELGKKNNVATTTNSLLYKLVKGVEDAQNPK